MEEIEEVRRECKGKDVMLLEMEEEAEKTVMAVKEQFAQEKRRMLMDWEERVKALTVERNTVNQ